MPMGKCFLESAPPTLGAAMLVLSRKQEETIVINGQIEIMVVKIAGNKVRLGIRAPEEFKVLRGEVSPFDVEFEVAMDEFNSMRRTSKVKKNSRKKQASSGGRRVQGKWSNKQIIAQTAAQCDIVAENFRESENSDQPLRSRVEARNRLTQEMFDREASQEGLSEAEAIYPNAFFVV